MCDLINGKSVPQIGISLRNIGAIVSSSSFSIFDKKLTSASLSSAIKHEIGHVFIESKKHCLDLRCIMQTNLDVPDFIGRFVVPQLGFCKSCESEIYMNILKEKDPEFAARF